MDFNACVVIGAIFVDLLVIHATALDFTASVVFGAIFVDLLAIEVGELLVGRNAFLVLDLSNCTRFRVIVDLLAIEVGELLVGQNAFFVRFLV